MCFYLEYKFYKFHISKTFEELFICVIIHFGTVEVVRQFKFSEEFGGVLRKTPRVCKGGIRKTVVRKVAVQQAIIQKGVGTRKSPRLLALALKKAQKLA